MNSALKSAMPNAEMTTGLHLTEQNTQLSAPMHVEEPIGKTIYFETRAQIRKRTFFLRVAILLIIINLLLIVNAFSQLVTVNGVTITNSAQITVKGDILFTTGSASDNDGSLEVSGDFINNSGSNLFGASAGTVVLNGGNQQIAGSSVTHFNNLNLQGGGTKTLALDAVTGGNNGVNSGVLSLNNARLDLNANELTVNNSTASAITRTSGFIISETDPSSGYGTVKWMAGNNTGNYVMPFGNPSSGHYLPVSFEINTPGTGASGYLSVATYPTNTTALPNNRPLPTGLTSLLSVAGTENASNTVDRWWVMDVNGYSDKPVSTLSLTYRDSEWDASGGSTNMITENMLQAQSNNGAVWNPMTMGTVNTTSNTVVVSNINNYNPFWTLVGSNNPLPVELLVFDAQLNKQKDVDLNWITAAEVENDFFTVERSRDGVNFEELGYVDGAGSTSNNSYYHFVDENPYNGINYYRLKQTDFDGDFSYSGIKAVKLEMEVEASMLVYPNPATDRFFVNLNGEADGSDMFITDLNGKVIRTIPVDPMDEKGSAIVEVQRDNLAPGIYMITVPGRKSVKLVIN